MASVLDVGILEYFTPVFVFLFVFAIIFAVLEKTGILGKNKGLNSLVAFAIAVLFILTPEMTRLVHLAMPWFAVLLISIVLIVLLFLFVGVKGDLISETMSRSGVVVFVIVLCFFIFMYALSEVYGPEVRTIYGEGEVGDLEGSFFKEHLGKVIFHPRALGVILLFVIVAFAVRFMAKNYV